MATLEQMEKLCAMANISFEEAKSALDAANGDLLDAIIALEKVGKVHAPTGGGYYSSEKTFDRSAVSGKENCGEKHDHNGHKENPFISFLKKTGEFCLKLFRRGNANSFEALHNGEIKASFPITVLALMLIFAFWVTIPLLIIGMFFGLRYRFIGSDFKGNTINDAMNSAANAAEELKKSINI